MPGMMWKGVKAGDGGRLLGIDEVCADFKGGVAPPSMGAVQQWYTWRREKDDKDEEKSREEEHGKFARRMTSSAEGRAGFLHRIAKPTAWKGGWQVFQDLEE